MKKLHLVSGLPRSGSTLLCQILNMNPDFHATHTSPMLEMLMAQQSVFSHNGGFKAVDRLESYDPFANAQRAFLKTWYEEKNIVFDKNRGWPMHMMKLDEIMDNEDTKILWTYRPPVEVIASMESQHRKYPLIQYVDEQQNPGALSILDSRIGHWISDNGIISTAARALHEAVHTGYEDRIMIIDYKQLCKKPKEMMDSVHEFLGIDKFDYASKEWKDLKQSTFEFDNLYNYKYPHTIKEGSIEYVEHDTEYLSLYTETISKRFEWLIKHCSQEINKEANRRVSRSERRANHRPNKKMNVK